MSNEDCEIEPSPNKAQARGPGFWVDKSFQESSTPQAEARELPYSGPFPALPYAHV